MQGQDKHLPTVSDSCAAAWGVVKFRRMQQATIIRVMTYNVHRCVGADGVLEPQRIVDIITHFRPDVVALQELDVRRARTGFVDQAHWIATKLEMAYHFHAAFQVEEEKFGDAILSRLPMSLVHAAALPVRPPQPLWERRGALWATITCGARQLQFINTHLSVNRWERRRQAEAVLGKHWLDHPACLPPRILCGDFNALPGSRVHRRCTELLRDVYASKSRRERRPGRTFSTRMPLARIDHVFLSEDLQVARVEVPRTALTRVASDHFPLVVDVALP